MGRSKDDPEQRVVVHDKSSLAPEAPSILFSISPDRGFTWDGFCDTSADELLSGRDGSLSKTRQAEMMLRDALESGPLPSEELLFRSSALGISERTLKIAKQNLGVTAFRQGDRWYAQLPQEGKKVTS